ncbi:MAG TPA: 2-dehydro-3-deoxygalactonokinase [Povalibacter sp.]|uniref:2-dehydro-3-deoxygalactonokinase n=1 Tax=Povalibacter sp. TaxID=1962978 RepID=UPI002BFA28DB|nr:2-dehydro-3-deoxygalactonokinase [Povalibacter sp.]HMN45385.1 2-dehydro-3-deoxygalactonokinase [Povalibacter sp.]
MTKAAFIAGDWGTTNLRLFLVDDDSTVRAAADGPGVAQVPGRFDSVLTELTSSWRQEHGPLPVILCGMVGSTIGWMNVPYVPCPAPPARIAGAMASIAERSVFIAPGLSCRNRYGAPDVMRGEETQILGALHQNPSLARGRHLLCLPGTHAKWVVLRDSSVEEFLTAVTGELFAVIDQHSVLVRAGDRPAGFDEAAFDAGVQRALSHPQAALVHLLFECRSRQVTGDLAREQAPDFLSGLLIAHDVLGALRLFTDVATGDSPVTIIANSSLAERYRRALQALRMNTAIVDGSQASLGGLTLLHSIRFSTGGVHAD